MRPEQVSSQPFGRQSTFGAIADALGARVRSCQVTKASPQSSGESSWPPSWRTQLRGRKCATTKSKSHDKPSSKPLPIRCPLGRKGNTNSMR